MSRDVVGREQELETIASTLAAPSSGFAAVLVSGDAGVGKTTLWKAALTRAPEGYRVLVARPAESERELPFVALSDLLEEVDLGGVAELPPPQRRALDIALLRAEAEGSPLHRRAVALGLLAVLRALAASGPVLIAVDDAQWLDPASASALEFALRRLEREPIVVLAAQRPHAPGELPLDLVHDVPEERLRHIHVAPLGLEALGRLVRERTGRRLLRPELSELHRVSGGNPFIALELARSAGAGGPSAGGDESLRIPTSLRALVHRRLAGLSEPAREAALAVAALARPSVAALEAALDVGREAIADGVAAGVLEVEGERIRLTHPILGSVLYAEAAPERRRDLHRRLAALPGDLEERARHLALAAVGPDGAVAAALDDAAHSARFRGALDAAAGLAEQAARLTPDADAEAARRRTTEAAEYHFDAGALVRSRILLERLSATSPHGPARADALVRLSEVTFAEDGWAAALEPLSTALDEAGDDPRLGARIERGLAWGYHMAGDLATAAAHARASAEWAERLGDPAQLAETLANQAFLEFLRGKGFQEATMHRALALEAAADRIPISDRPSWLLAVTLQYSDELDRARSTLERLHAESAERGDESSRPFTLHYFGRIDCRAGRYASAERFAQEALDITLQTGQAPEQAFTRSTCALVAAHLGRTDAARAHVEEGLWLAGRTEMKPAEFELLATLGFLELSLGDAAEAHAVLGPLATSVAAAGFGEPAVFRFHPNAVEALIGLGRLEEAAALLEWLDHHAAALGGAWASATAGRCRGLLLAAEGDLERAVPALEAALDQHGRMQEPFEQARTLLVLGATHRRDRKKAAARGALERAREIFDALPAPHWSEKARAELARLGGRPSARWHLTETERRVAELVATGRTNREVADALFISVKTVEWNLSKVYGKLSVRSRTELASKIGAVAANPGASPGSEPRPPT